MNVAIAALGKEEDSQVSERAGRAPYYLLFEEGRLVEAWKNPFAAGGGGAGWSVARVLAEKGVELAIAGRFGGKMEQALDEAGIRHEERRGSVAAALR